MALTTAFVLRGGFKTCSAVDGVPFFGSPVSKCTRSGITT